MHFNNKENECVETKDGRKIFVSRSCAVVPIVICDVEQNSFKQTYVLLNKRGPGCPDYVGAWSLPCGYLDWDESGAEAAIREIWEECGLDVASLALKAREISDGSLFKNISWKVVTEPGADARQNVIFNYAVRFVVESLPAVSLYQDKADEVSEVKWLEIEEAVLEKLAFNHQLNIAEYLSRA